MSPQEAMGGIEGKTLIRTLYPITMGRITKDELGLPLIARGSMEEEVPVHEKQDRGRRVPTRSRTEEKIGIAIIGIDEDEIVHHHQEECKKIVDDESRGRQQNTVVAEHTLYYDLLRAGLLVVLLYIQFAISFSVPDNKTSFAFAGTHIRVKLWSGSRTAIASSLVYFGIAAILYRRMVRHANHYRSDGHHHGGAASGSAMLLLYALPELVALSTLVCAFLYGRHVAVVLFLVGKFVMAATALVYWVVRFLLLSSS
jgi:hypothetical protein